MTIIIFLIVLVVLILVHEFGHFIVAKKSGVRVDEFALGFPPKIWSKKWGGTTYILNLVPFGGFVKIFGEDAHSTNLTDEEKSVSFVHKSKPIQAAILAAGIAFNIFFAGILIAICFMIGMPAPAGYSPFGETRDAKVVVLAVAPDSPAATAGLVSGDEILFLNSGTETLQNETLTPDNIRTLISKSEGQIEFMYKRGDNNAKTAFITPTSKDGEETQTIGIAMDSMGTLKLPPHTAILEGVRTTAIMTAATAVGLWDFLYNIVTFNSDFSQVSGPVGIATVVGEANTLGFVYLLSLVALISINLAIINLIPFPALDGGRLLFVLVEAITRRPIPVAFVQWTNTIGFLLLILLMIVVTGKDIMKLF
jgi:regulator of sigma E protease